MPTGIYKRTKEHSLSISSGLKGRILSSEQKKNISLALKGNKNGKGNIISPENRVKMVKAFRVIADTKEHREKLSKATKGIKKSIRSKEHCEKIRQIQLNKLIMGISNVGKKGEDNPVWIKDRTKLKKRQQRNDYAYKEWRKQVWLRDNFKCKIENTDCMGRIEAHHILAWRDYPELRYQSNNGITLCHFHHPRKREDEIKLSPFFKKLVASK